MTAAALAIGSMGTAHAAAAPAKNVSYRGHTFAVPVTWKIIDLTNDPTACVRFDRHAVYPGTPGAEQNCPARAVGRTEALLVEPAGAAVGPARVTENDAAHT